MAADIGPGTLLECIKADADGPRTTLQVGRIYTCREVIAVQNGYSSCCGRADMAIKLEEVGPPNDASYGYCRCCFRPLPPRSKHIEDMLSRLSEPAKEPEHA